MAQYTKVEGLHGHPDIDSPVDDQDKRKEIHNQLDHPHHLLFWQLSEDFSDIYMMLSSQICPQIPKAYTYMDACCNPFAGHRQPGGKHCLSNVLNRLQHIHVI